MEFLCRQTGNTTKDNIIPKHSSHESSTCPLNAIIASESFKSIKESVKQSSDAELM